MVVKRTMLRFKYGYPIKLNHDCPKPPRGRTNYLNAEEKNQDMPKTHFVSISFGKRLKPNWSSFTSCDYLS